MTGHDVDMCPPDHTRVRPAGPVNPFELGLLAACVVQGWAVLAGVAHSAAIEAALPPSLRTAWGFLLFAGGVLSLTGLYWRDPFDGVEIKRVGLVCVAGGTLAYGVALLFLGAAGVLPAVSNLYFTAACLVRVRQVSVALRASRARIAMFRRVAARPTPEGR